MINPQSVNPLTLPFVPLDRGRRTSRFPMASCVYFAVSQDGKVQYIGQAVCLRQRWQWHSKELALLKMGQINIAYLLASSDCLDYLEQSLILRFNPPLNKLRPRKAIAQAMGEFNQ